MTFQRAAGWCEAARVCRGNTSRSCPLNCAGIRGVSGAPVIARGASAPVEAVFARRRRTRGGTAKFRPLLIGAEGVFDGKEPVSYTHLEGNIEFLGHLCMEPGDALVPDVPALVAAAHETLKG